MIFLFHLLSWVAASLGLMLAYELANKKIWTTHRAIALFLIMLSIGMFIHLFFDATVNDHINFINAYINLAVAKARPIFSLDNFNESKIGIILRDMLQFPQPLSATSP